VFATAFEAIGQAPLEGVAVAEFFTASVYAVMDQPCVNNKISSPKCVGDLDRHRPRGATPASAGSASGSAGSTVPGQ
jgi:hypothetical protein